MNKKALIIDDSRGDFQLIKIYLMGAGWKDEILWASNGEDGIQVVQQSNPQVVFLDLNLPGLDGFDVCRQLKSIKPDIHIIIISGSKDPQAPVKAKEYGADGFCHKQGGSIFETLKHYYQNNNVS